MRFVIALLLTIPLFAYGQQDIPSLSANAPKDKPFRWQAEELSQKEAVLAPFIEAARKNYPQAKGKFISGLPSDEDFLLSPAFMTDPNTNKHLSTSIKLKTASSREKLQIT